MLSDVSGDQEKDVNPPPPVPKYRLMELSFGNDAEVDSIYVKLTKNRASLAIRLSGVPTSDKFYS